MEDAHILVRAQGALGRLMLNRPKALNALTLPMCESITAALKDWESAPEIRAVLIEAVPGRAFCAGGDMRAIYELGKARDPRAMEFFAKEYALNLAIAEYPKPYVALLDGIVMGGGAGVSVHGKFRIVTENTVFAMPETAIGFFPDIGASYFLPRCPGAMGLYLGLTGARIDGADMLALGLATHFVPAVRIGEIAPRLSAGEDMEAVLASLSAVPPLSRLAALRDRVDRAFAGGSLEIILSALRNEGEWGAQTAALLRRLSPTSLKLVHRQLLNGAMQKLEDCLAMELRIAAELLQGEDFYEGVRAVLIDKDHAPDWRPSRLEEVGEEALTRYFSPPSPFGGGPNRDALPG